MRMLSGLGYGVIRPVLPDPTALGTLMRYVATYNHHIPQRALRHISPVEAPKEWYRKKPDLFVSEVNNLTGLDRLKLEADRCHRLPKR